jgi:hypothetical protein
MHILGTEQINSLFDQSRQLKFIQADSTEESEMIFAQWADVEGTLKMSKKNFNSYLEGRVAIKYCMLTGFVPVLN